jgi:hypothetical protein
MDIEFLLLGLLAEREMTAGEIRNALNGKGLDVCPSKVKSALRSLVKKNKLTQRAGWAGLGLPHYRTNIAELTRVFRVRELYLEWRVRQPATAPDLRRFHDWLLAHRPELLSTARGNSYQQLETDLGANPFCCLASHTFPSLATAKPAEVDYKTIPAKPFTT